MKTISRKQKLTELLRLIVKAFAKATKKTNTNNVISKDKSKS